MNKKYRKITWLVSLVVLLLISCKDEEEVAVNNEIPEYNQPELIYEVNPRAFVLKFTDYIGNTTENVKKLDKDTIQISINERLLQHLQISELKAGDVLNIWENIDVPPYIRVVDAVEKHAENYVVTTHEGQMTDLFLKFSGALDTELFSDISDRPERLVSRNGTRAGDIQYVDHEEDFEQFVDDSGKIHPFIIYTKDAENPDKFNYELSEIEYDERVDSIIGSRVSAFFSIVDYKKEHINIYPLKDEKGSPFGMYVKDASLECKINLELFFQYNVFSSNRFWAKTKGNLNIDIPLHVQFEEMEFKEKKEIPVAELQEIKTGFFIAFFYVPITIKPSIVFKYSADIKGKVSLMIPIECNANFTFGPMYDNSQWSCYKDFGWYAGIDKEKFAANSSASFSMESKAGLYLKVGAYLGSAFGPFFEMGPQASVEAKANLLGQQVSFNTKGTVSLGGSVGAEIKVWKFNLGKASLPFSLLSRDLWNQSFKFNLEDAFNGSTNN